MAHAEESTSKRKTLEIEKEETEELKQKYLVWIQLYNDVLLSQNIALDYYLSFHTDICWM